MFAQATPAFGDVEHGFAAPGAQDRAANEHRRPQRGRTLETAFHPLGSKRSTGGRRAVLAAGGSVP